MVMDDVADLSILNELMRKPEGISAVEKLLNEFEAHEANEEKSVEEYRKALDGMRDPASRFVMQMIISDEEKHRAVMHAMASTLRGSLNWTRPAASLEGPTDEAEIKRKLGAVTEEFINVEKAGIKEYKKLRKESSEYYHGLFEVLFDVMIRDSEKHVEMLEFLSRRLKSA
jgi:bacterioferritin (cytochrome b1)